MTWQYVVNVGIKSIFAVHCTIQNTTVMGKVIAIDKYYGISHTT